MKNKSLVTLFHPQETQEQLEKIHSIPTFPTENTVSHKNRKPFPFFSVGNTNFSLLLEFSGAPFTFIPDGAPGYSPRPVWGLVFTFKTPLRSRKPWERPPFSGSHTLSSKKVHVCGTKDLKGPLVWVRSLPRNTVWVGEFETVLNSSF